MQPIRINSKLVTGALRDRFYWTNIPNVTQPMDLGLNFKDIIEDHVDEKYYLTNRGTERVIQKQGKDLVGDKSKCLFATYHKNYSSREGQIVYGENGQMRRLTPTECERLQTVPSNYTDGVSDTQRYKMLGNGWTIDVITHILKNIL